MGKRKHQDFSKLSLIIAVLALLVAFGSFGFSIYVYEKSTLPTTLSGLVETRLNTVQSELDNASKALLELQAYGGNLTKLQDMLDQAQALYLRAQHDWVQLNLGQAENEALQAENIIYEFNLEARSAGGMPYYLVGAILGGVIAAGLIILFILRWLAPLKS